MNFGQWNIQSLTNKQMEVFKELERLEIDLAVLSETKKKGKGIEEIGKYIHIYSGVNKECRAKKGVSIAIHKKYKQCIKKWDCINEYLVKVDLKLKGYETTIVGIYAPNDDAKIAEKNEFYDDLTNLLDQIGQRRELYLIGDFNGRVGSQDKSEIVGKFGEEVVNENGERLIELCQQYELKIWNGFFEHKEIHKYTWIQPTRNLRSIIDYLVGKQQNKTRVTNCRVKRGALCGSDHYLLKSNVFFPYINRKQLVCSEDEQRNEAVEPVYAKYKLELLQDPSTVFLYKLRLSSKLTNVNETSAVTIYEDITKAIHEAAYESLGLIEERARNQREYWWSEEIAQKIGEKRLAYQKWLSTKDPEDRKDYVRISRESKKEVLKAKNDYWERRCQGINTYLGSTKSREAWKVIKNLRTNEKLHTNIQLISQERWQEYYSKIMKEDRQQFIQLNEIQEQIDGAEENIEEITLEELQGVMKTFKNGTAPGPGAINIELLKSAPIILHEYIVKMLNLCLHGDELPKQFKEGYISNVFKKGNKNECTNYRGITVLNTIGRLYGKVLKTRIEEDFVDLEEQSGFRAGRSCIDNIFILRQVTDKRLAHNLETHLVYVDLSKAYDSVPLVKMWEAMERQGIKNIYINTVRNLYTGNTSRIKIGRMLSKSFTVDKGLRQGCCLAPTLFKIFLAETLQNWRNKCGPMGIQIHDVTLYSLNFADDQIIFAEDESDINYMFRKLKEEYRNWGLEINLTKTEYMVVGGLGSNIVLDDGSIIKCCKTYKYLGTMMSNEGGSEIEIRHRMQKGRVAIKQLHSIIWNNTIHKDIKRRIYKTIVESIMLYGAELWEVSKKNENKLKAVEMDYWRRSCCVSRLQKIRNEIIREQMQVTAINIIDSIEGRRLSWYGHLKRMSPDRWPQKVYNWQPPQRKKRGRPRLSWNDCVQRSMEDRQMTDKDWSNRERWKRGCERRRMV